MSTPANPNPNTTSTIPDIPDIPDLPGFTRVYATSGRGDTMADAITDLLNKITAEKEAAEAEEAAAASAEEAAVPAIPMADLSDWIIDWLGNHMMLTGEGRASEAKRYIGDILDRMKRGLAIDAKATAIMGYTPGEPKTVRCIRSALCRFYSGCKMGRMLMEMAKGMAIREHTTFGLSCCITIADIKLDDIICPHHS